MRRFRSLGLLPVLVLGLACGEGDLVVTTAPGPQTGTSGSSAGKAGASGAAGTGGQAGAATKPGPGINGLAILPATTTDLAGRVKVELDVEADVEVVFTDEKGHTVKVASQAASKSHLMRFFGLRTGRTYTARVTAEKADGGVTQATPLLHPTKALPADFPPLEVVKGDPTRAGYTMFPVSRFGSQGVDQNWGYVVVVDGAGEVVWYFATGRDLSDVRRTKSGLLRMVVDDDGTGDVHLLDGAKGGILATNLNMDVKLVPGVVGVPLDTIHHDEIELPSGNVLTLATEKRTVKKTDCPKTYDKDYEVVGDVVVEIEPATGKIVSQVSTFDLLDPCRRVDTAFKSQFWVPLYGMGSADWTHANAVFYDEKTDTVMVSLRHQDWVVAYHKGSDGKDAGKLLWKLGPEGDFAFAGSGSLAPYHQHAAKLLANGHLALYDNGTTRPGTDDLVLAKIPASRAVELALDTSGAAGTWTATEIFAWSEERTKDAATGASVPWYSSVVGDFDVTAEGTALVTHGCATDPPNAFILDPMARKFARIVEATHDAERKVLLDVRVRDPKEKGFQNYLVYRAERYATLDWAQ